jgi:hypothetical protein
MPTPLIDTSFKIKNADQYGAITPRFGYFVGDTPTETHIGPDFTREVSNGIRLLKRVDPRWFDHIALDALNLDNAYSCVLGQTAVSVFHTAEEGKGNYWDVIRLKDQLGIQPEQQYWTNSCGFNILMALWEEKVEDFLNDPKNCSIEEDDFIPGMFNKPYSIEEQSASIRIRGINLNENFMWARLGDEWKRRIRIIREKDQRPSPVRL